MKKNHWQEMTNKVIEKLEKYCNKEDDVTYADVVKMLVALNLSLSEWLSLKADIPAGDVLNEVLRAALEIHEQVGLDE